MYYLVAKKFFFMKFLGMLQSFYPGGPVNILSNSPPKVIGVSLLN